MNIHTVKHNDLLFINTYKPQDLEIKHLKKEFGFLSFHLDDYLGRVQIPQVDIQKNYSLVILDIPFYDMPEQKNGNNNKSLFPDVVGNLSLPAIGSSKKSKRVRATHINFFIGTNYLVVLHDDATPQINEIFTECQKTLKARQEFMSEGPVFLFYRIADALVDSCFGITNEISSIIDGIDKKLIADDTNEVMEPISITRRNIVVFQTMIKPALTIFSDFAKGRYEQFNPSMHDFWSNTLDHLQKIWDRLEDNKELLQGISISHESLLTNRTNETMKVLTMFTAILLPLTLLASIYGMNIVGLPYAQNPAALLIIVEVMIALAAGMILLFRAKKWL